MKAHPLLWTATSWYVAYSTINKCLLNMNKFIFIHGRRSVKSAAENRCSSCLHSLSLSWISVLAAGHEEGVFWERMAYLCLGGLGDQCAGVWAVQAS